MASICLHYFSYEKMTVKNPSEYTLCKEFNFKTMKTQLILGIARVSMPWACYHIYDYMYLINWHIASIQ